GRVEGTGRHRRVVDQGVVGLEGDPGDATRRQGLFDARPERGRVNPDKGVGTGVDDPGRGGDGLDAADDLLGDAGRDRGRDVAGALVHGTPGHAAGPARVEAGQPLLDGGVGDGRVEGQHADVLAADAAALQGAGDALLQGDEALGPVRVEDGA